MTGQVKEHQSDMSSGGPGIVVLSPSLEVLHMNRQTRLLISGLVPSALEGQQPNNQTGVLPPILIDLAVEILNVLRSRHEMSRKGQFEVRHVADSLDKRVLIRGIGLPSTNRLRDSRIVFVLAELSVDHINDLGFPRRHPEILSRTLKQKQQAGGTEPSVAPSFEP
jgi:hypothetical protein